MLGQVAQLQDLLTKEQVLLLSNISDIRYFSDFEHLVPSEREAVAMVGKDFAYLIHASFSPKPNNEGFVFLPGLPGKFAEHLKTIKNRHNLAEILIDEESLFVSELRELERDKDWQIKPFSREIIWQLRKIKTEKEIELISLACTIAKKAYQSIQKKIKPGITEKQLCLALEEEMRQLGSTKPAFPTIVAFAENTALPHHQPSTKKLEKEMAVLIDFGATVAGYCSDVTRSFWFGTRPDDKYLQIEQSVRGAYQAVIESLNDQTTSYQKTAQQLDDLARKYITQTGFGGQFIHTTGHGVGLDIHEPPSLSWKNEDKILPGMIITVEPGIYLENQFGYRYENTIYISKQQPCLELTK